MKQKKLNADPFIDLKINENLEDTINSELTEEDRNAYLRFQSLGEAIDKEYNSFGRLGKSMLLRHIIIYSSSLHGLGITKENYREMPIEQDEKECYGLFFEVIDGLETVFEPYRNSCFDVVKLIHGVQKKTVKKVYVHIDLTKINSTFFDYHLLKYIKKTLLKSEFKIAKELISALPELTKQLENSITLYDIDREDLKDASLFFGNGPLKGLKIKLTKDIIEKLTSPLDIVNAFNSKLFQNTINKEMLEQLLILLKGMENDVEFSSLFVNFDKVFGKKDRLRLRARKLFMHDVFMVYGHLRALTDKDEDRYTTIDSFEKAKIRVVETLVPNLK